MKKRTQHLIVEVPRKRGQVDLTIGNDPGDVWSHSYTFNQQGDVIDRGRPACEPMPRETWLRSNAVRQLEFMPTNDESSPRAIQRNLI